MTEGAGVIRDAAGLTSALSEIAAIESGAESAPLLNMTATATLIATAALRRTESRGAHFRADFPAPSGPVGRRSFLTPAEALAPSPLETT